MGKERHEKLEEVVSERQKWTSNQLRVMFLFLAIVLLWSFRVPINNLTGLNYTDEGAAVFGAILLFFIPSDTKKPLLDWKDTRKLSWGILILFGGGMALANMLQENGVIDLLSKTFESFSGESLVVILTVLVVIAIYGTELMSNLALVAVFVPIVADFAMKTDFSIIQLCIPITLAASCAFMLPVGTPPNAIVFSSGLIKIHQMAKIGFILNIIATIIVCFFAFLFF